MITNENLKNAKAQKKDEFYTSIYTIIDELELYTGYFKDKVVYCNCDVYSESHFVKYFMNRFKLLGLKRLVATNYKYSANGDGEAHIFIYDGEKQYLDDLIGDGSYDSWACKEVLKTADVVVTNPPYSKFTDFLQMLIEYKKDFIILGNVNAITVNSIFPLIRDRKVWLGDSIHSGNRRFYVPDDYPMDARNCGYEYVELEKDKPLIDSNYIMVKGVRWFTNVQRDFPYCYDLKLNKSYYEDPQYYSFYDEEYLGEKVINVDKVKDIPYDYKGIMGVPITFIDKWNPEQFKILGDIAIRPKVNGKAKYRRLLIKNISNMTLN